MPLLARSVPNSVPISKNFLGILLDAPQKTQMDFLVVIRSCFYFCSTLWYTILLSQINGYFLMKNPRNIVITGASSGLGAALARHYAAPGITLHLQGRHGERLAAVAQTCQERGAAVYFRALDVTDAPAM